jgi:hypothetical protein
MRKDIAILFLLVSLASFCMGSPKIGCVLATESSTRYWGLIVQGAFDPCELVYLGDAQYMYHIMSEHYVFDGICYLSINTSLPGATNKTNKENLDWSIRQWLGTNSGPNDVIFIFFATHGKGYNAQFNYTDDIQAQNNLRTLLDEGGDEGNETGERAMGFDINQDGSITDDWIGTDEGLYLNSTAPNGFISDDWLKDSLAVLNYSKLVLATTACFSGGLIDDLSSPDRIIMTATNETDEAIRALPGFFSRMSPWASEFMDALHGRVVWWDCSTSQLYHKPSEVDADYNGDGNVSLLEAWNYS